MAWLRIKGWVDALTEGLGGFPSSRWIVLMLEAEARQRIASAEETERSRWWRDRMIG